MSSNLFSIKGKEWYFPVNYHILPHLLTWRLHPIKLRMITSFTIPIFGPQSRKKHSKILTYSLYQSCNLDFSLQLTGLSTSSKSHSSSIEDLLIDILISAISFTDNSIDNEEEELKYWSFLLSNVTQFCLSYVTSVEGIIQKLHKKIPFEKSINGRYWFSWLLYHLVMLHISHAGKGHEISASLEILDELFPEVNAPSKCASIDSFRNIAKCGAALCWRAMSKKLIARQAENDWPSTLRMHYSLIGQLITEAKDNAANLGGFKLVLFLMIIEPFHAIQHIDRFIQKHWSDPNTFATYPYVTYRTNGPINSIDINIFALIGPTARLAITRAYVRNVIRVSMASTDRSILLSPGGVENFARVLSFAESEQITMNECAGIMRQCWTNNNLDICSLYCELFAFRLGKINQLQSSRLTLYPELIAFALLTNNGKADFANLQLMTTAHFCALNILSFTRSSEVIMILWHATDAQLETFISSQSHELNKSLVLKIIRSMSILGVGRYSEVGIKCFKFLKQILQKSPHSWPDFILAYMPKYCQDMFANYQVQEVHMGIQEEVNEEFTRLVKISTGIIVLDSEMSRYLDCSIQPDMFLPYIYKVIINGMPLRNSVPVLEKMLGIFNPDDTIGMLSKFVDFLSSELKANSTLNMRDAYFKNSVDALIHMCFTFHILCFDRLIYTLLVRPANEQAIQITLVFVLCILMKCTQLDEARKLLPTITPNFSLNPDWYNTHLNLNQAIHEKPLWEGVKEMCKPRPKDTAIPMFYLNLAFRMIPVIDIFNHRLIELPLISKQLDKISKFAFLYKFHGAPIHYVYTTLFYYFKLLCTQKLDSWRIVKAILSVIFVEYPEECWCYEKNFQEEVHCPQCSELGPVVEQNIENVLSFTIKAITESMYVNIPSQAEMFKSCPSKQSDSLNLPRLLPNVKSKEFHNIQLQALYACAIQVMTISPDCELFWSVIHKSINSSGFTSDYLHQKMNVIGLIYSALPLQYLSPVFKCLENLMKFELGDVSTEEMLKLFNSDGPHFGMKKHVVSKFTVALHAILEHATETAIFEFIRFCEDTLSFLCDNEHRYLYLCQVVLPFLPKMQLCGTEILLAAVNCLFKALVQVDKQIDRLTGDKADFSMLYQIRCTSLRNSLNILLSRKSS
ncbi:hypothetical protein GJ496_010204 [Pomphorhynchus laevis]|nr:hypothetical protein GJ496_010204 [Pomphorhynchus laevis]